jgi:hypothetical protein
MKTGENMDETQIREQIEGLRHMTTGQLKEKYREVYCTSPCCHCACWRGRAPTRRGER